MKNVLQFLLILFVLISFNTVNLPGKTNSLNISGYIQTYNRLNLDTKSFTWNENLLNIKFEGAPSDKYHYFSEIRIKGLGIPNVNQSLDLQKPEKDMVFRWGLEFREAYLDLYQFIFKNLDIRIGRQIITWGTADKLNPTSNISPDDLEDIFNFGEQLGTNAIKASYYWGDVTFTGIFIPIFTPAVLPYGNFSNALSTQMDLPDGMTVRDLSDNIVLPGTKVSESSQYAFKAAFSLFDYDISLSYYNGRDDLPIAKKVTISPIDLAGTVDIKTELFYPKIQVVGGDFAGTIGSIGVWGEGALFFSEKVELDTFIPTSVGLLSEKTLILDDKPYFKYVLGCDYTFNSGLYLNIQYIHGFMHERGSMLNDYLVFRFEKKFLNDELKIVPFGAVLTVNDWNDIENNYGLVLGPFELIYYPSDNVELTLGAYILEGKGSNMFSQIKKNDAIYMKAKVSF